jgi:hypothetical protein
VQFHLVRYLTAEASYRVYLYERQVNFNGFGARLGPLAEKRKHRNTSGPTAVILSCIDSFVSYDITRTTQVRHVTTNQSIFGPGWHSN